MPEYRAPLYDMEFLLFDVFQAQHRWQAYEPLAELLDEDTARAMLAEAGKLAATTIARGLRDLPRHRGLRRRGDRVL